MILSRLWDTQVSGGQPLNLNKIIELMQNIGSSIAGIKGGFTRSHNGASADVCFCAGMVAQVRTKLGDRSVTESDDCMIWKAVCSCA